MSMGEQIDAVRLYKQNSFSIRQIAAIYSVSESTVYEVLDRFNVPRRRPELSAIIVESNKRRWEKEKARKADSSNQAVYSPDLRDQYLVAEPPSPSHAASDGVDIDKVHTKPKRKYQRKKKSLWQRIKDKLLRR